MPDAKHARTRAFALSAFNDKAFTSMQLLQWLQPPVFDRPRRLSYVHACTGMEGLFMPYDHVAHVADGPKDQATLSMLHTLNRLMCRNKCIVGSGGASVGYLAHGTATDYMFTKLDVPVAMTWEIYGDETAAFSDCFKMFNPLTTEGYTDVLRRWTNAVFQTILLMRTHPAAAGISFGTGDQRRGGTNGADFRVDDRGLHHVASRLGAANHGNSTYALYALHGHQTVVAFSHHSANRTMVIGLAFFVVTVALWCYGRRCLLQSRWRSKSHADVRAE
jgi:hypothetical protein